MASSCPRATANDDALSQLTATFDSFNRMSSELARAWEELRDRTARLDLALSDANVRLNEKVIELDELNSNLDAILDSIPSAAIVVDAASRVTRVNRAAESILGLDRAYVVGRSAETIRDAAGAPLLDPIRDAEEPLGATPREIVLADGRQRVITSSVSEVVDAKGRVLGRVQIVSDVTEIEALRQRLHRLDTLAALGEMAAAIAHELRTPLQAVEGYAALLRRSLEKGADRATVDRQALNIERGAHDASAIIQRLLTFANPGVLRRDFVSLEEVARDALSGHDNVRLEVAPLARGACTKGDHLLLRQALRNLIENACQVAPETPITITLSRTTDELEMRVIDRGPGLPPAIKDRLFMPFVTAREGGTGLGLAIVHRIIDLHGGDIRAEDNPAGGASFVIRLPAMRTSGETARSA
ncbi:MAG: ATP-binding protein [Planctomycetota bacterium]